MFPGDPPHTHTHTLHTGPQPLRHICGYTPRLRKCTRMYAHTPEEPDLPQPAQNSWGTASVIAALPAPHTAAPLLLKAAGDNPGAQAEEEREGNVRSEAKGVPASVLGTWDSSGSTLTKMLSLAHLFPTTPHSCPWRLGRTSASSWLV